MEISTLLDKNETAVFKACYDNSLEKESKIIDIREATRSIVEGGISTDQIQDCLEIILKRCVADECVGKSGSGEFRQSKLTHTGLFCTQTPSYLRLIGYTRMCWMLLFIEVLRVIPRLRPT
jgi:hypothetical protein